MFCAPGLVFSVAECVGSRFHVLRSRNRFRRCRVLQVSFSCFARLNAFSTVPSVSAPDFKFCVLVLVFGGFEGVGSRFHFLHARTHFGRYRRRRVSFLCFALPDSFSAVPRASGPVFMFCAPQLDFGGTEFIRSRFHVLRSRTRFRRYRGPRVPFSSFARRDSFSVVPRASGPVFMFCAPGLVFGCKEGVGSRFHVLRSRTHFRR
jgi:hypothetical protein